MKENIAMPKFKINLTLNIIMKKSIMAIVVLGMAIHAHAQTITQTTDGKVGIGTSSPSEKLEIYDSTTTPGTISLKSSRNDAGFVDVGKISAKQSSTEVSRIGMPRAGGTYTGYLTFWTKDNNNSSITEKMRINEFGNVGIGTTAPASRLDVRYALNPGEISKNGINSILTTYANSNITSYDKAIYSFIGNFSIAPNVTDSGYKIGVDASAYANSTGFKGTLRSNYGVWARAGVYKATPGAKLNYAAAVQAEILDNVEGVTIENAYGVKISTAGYKKANVINRYDLYAETENAINYFAGKVGVGTSTPNSKLEVHHSSQRTVQVNPQNQLDVTGSSSLIIKEFVPSIEYFDSSSSSAAAVTFANSNKFFIGKKTGGPLTSSSLFNVDLNTGHVGIGTTTPDSKLAVNGKIHAKEVKVDLVGWPDYVFENSYELPTLKEVEKHIAEKGHLPNIPSAKEVEKAGGIELGEMNKKLLEKVEELTLYTIQQDKELKKQSKEIEYLKNQNSKLLELAKEIEIIKHQLKQK